MRLKNERPRLSKTVDDVGATIRMTLRNHANKFDEFWRIWRSIIYDSFGVPYDRSPSINQPSILDASIVDASIVDASIIDPRGGSRGGGGGAMGAVAPPFRISNENNYD